MSSLPTLTWLVTGCSTGIGRSIVLYGLEHKQRVIATGRNASRLSPLAEKGAHVEEIDPNASEAVINAWATRVGEKYGGIDVLVNNAGYVQNGTVEETGHDLLAAQFHTNVFATMNITRAFLPLMRARRSGTIFMIGSVVAYRFQPGGGLYGSSKAALRALTHALSAEVKDLGIRTCHIEPGLFRTAVFNRMSSSAPSSDSKNEKPTKAKIADYNTVRNASEKWYREADNTQNGDPDKLAAILYDLALGTGVAVGRPWPSALTLGGNAVDGTREVLKADLKRLEEWDDVSRSTDFEN